jgi:hypothetical protein
MCKHQKKMIDIKEIAEVKAEEMKEEQDQEITVLIFSRFFINIGSKDKVNASTLIGFINRKMKDQKFEIGKIDIMKKFSFFEIDKTIEKEVLKSFKNADFDGREVAVELSKPEPKKNSEKLEGTSNKKRKKKKVVFVLILIFRISFYLKNTVDLLHIIICRNFSCFRHSQEYRFHDSLVSRE